MTRVNITLEEELHQKAKMIAIVKKITLGEYLNLCIENNVKNDQGLLKLK